MDSKVHPGGIDCGQVLAHLAEYLEHVLDDVVQIKIDVHLLGCQNCARFGTEYGDLVHAVRDQGGTPLEQGIATRLANRLGLRLDHT